MSYNSRKGSLGFSFKKAKNHIPEGDLYSHSLWFHKVGMDHDTEIEKYTPRTHLELPDTRIKGHCHENNLNMYLDTELVKILDKSKIVTVLEIRPIFQKKLVYRVVSYVETIEDLYKKIVSAKYVKVTSITKGKGFSGVISRRGIKLGKRKRARANKERHVGAIGGRTRHVTWRAPQPGNMGNVKRTYKCNVIINTKDIKLKTFRHYGYVKNYYISVKGAIPGNIKTLVKVHVR
jgi:hypothetical protein